MILYNILVSKPINPTLCNEIITAFYQETNSSLKYSEDFELPNNDKEQL